MAKRDTTFTQPKLEDETLTEGETLPVLETECVEVDPNASDELSVAVRSDQHPAIAPVMEVEKPTCKYQLRYMYHGEVITESHATVRQAVARVRSLNSLGITPHTSTL